MHSIIIKQNLAPDYLDLFMRIRKDELNLSYFVKDMETSIQFCIEERQIWSICIRKDDVLVGHATFILSDQINAPCQLGFFELDSPDYFQLLWNEILKLGAQLGISEVTGLCNGSIWFPYRFVCINSGQPYFKGELPTPTYYHELLAPLASLKVNYFSSSRRSFETLLQLTAPHYESFGQSGFTFDFTHLPNESLLKEIYALSDLIFTRASVSYDQLPVDWFFKLYHPEKLTTLFRLYLVRDKQKLIAFATVFKENEHTLIYKTLAVHPDYQNKDIGKGLTHIIHKDAMEMGCEQMVYALIRGDNDIRYFPQDDVIPLRNYALLQLPLK